MYFFRTYANPETGESSYKRVVQTFERETDELVKATINGETITTTPTHPFYSPQKGWLEAIDLRAGDILVTVNGEYVVVEKVQHELLESPATVYNFEVEDFHTYYVGTSADAGHDDAFVLVHNDCRPKSPRKVDDNYIRQNRIDAHQFKSDVGINKHQSHWDIFRDTADGGKLWLGDKSQRIWRATKFFFSDLSNWMK